MASIFAKNGILSGHIDYYCLICSEQFTNEEEILAHIVDSQHKNKLESCGYFEKHKENFIRKVSAGLYFCEPCSLTFPTATKVGLHVEELTHIQEREINKAMQWVKRVKNNIIAFDKFLITEEAWNGFMEDTCILCNTEFDDSTCHKASRSHILNLIKNHVELDNADAAAAIYRMISPGSKHCLTCNIIIGNDPTDHFKTNDHKKALKMYDHHRNYQTEVTIKHENETSVSHFTSETGKAAKTDNSSPVNGNKKTAVKKDVNKEIVKNKLEHSVDSSKKNRAAELDDVYCKNLGAKNYITDKEGEKWCILCEWYLEYSPAEHIRSRHHQALLKLHKEKLENDSNYKSNVSGDDKKTLFESVDKYQKNNVNIDLINETAVCKKCSKNINFNIDAIEKHIEEHKKTTDKTSQENAVPFPSGIKSNGTDKTTLFTKPVLRTTGKNPVASAVIRVEDYAKQHGLSHNRADDSFYCNLCCRRLPTNLQDLEKHVASSIHKDNITKQSSDKQIGIKKPVKVNFLTAIETFELVETMTGLNIIINDQHWMNAFGFTLIAIIRGKILCYACNIDLTRDNFMDHIVTETHRRNTDNCLLVTSLEDEYIREIKLENYHCGYCNCVALDWEDILEHIVTEEHKREKSEQQRCLRNHKPNPFQRIQLRDMHTKLNSFLSQQGFIRF